MQLHPDKACPTAEAQEPTSFNPGPSTCLTASQLTVHDHAFSFTTRTTLPPRDLEARKYHYESSELSEDAPPALERRSEKHLPPNDISAIEVRGNEGGEPHITVKRISPRSTHTANPS